MSLTVVVIDRSPPVRHTQGNELIARHLFARLRRDHRIVLVAPVVGPIEFARDAVADLFDDVHLVPRAARVAALAGFVESHLAALPVGLPGPLDPGAARRLETVVTRVVAAEDPDVLHVRQLPMAKYGALGGSRPRLLELIDSEALASARDPDRSVRSGLRRRIAPALERRAIRGYDAVTTVAEPDAAAVRALDVAARVEVVPNGVDVDVFRPSGGLEPIPGRIVFVGAMSFPPNVAAMRWFVNSVLPAIRERLPQAHLAIVGRDPSPEVLSLGSRPGVAVTGSVDDVRPWLAAASVVVAPMISGGGIKNKILEALAMARPVVATPLAADGLLVVDGRDLVVAPPDVFAAAVVALLVEPDRGEAIGRAGRQLVETSYTWDSAAAAYARLYGEIAGARW